jgi:DNA mismatch repair protein MutS2
VLEFGKVRSILAEYAGTVMGKRKAKALEPDSEPASVRHALEETSELARAFSEGYSLPLGAIEDVTEQAERARAGGGPLEPAALWKVADCLDTAQRVANSLQRLGNTFPALVGLGHSVPVCPDLVKDIRSAINAKAQVVDDATPDLKAIRARVRRLRKRIEETLRRLTEKPDIRPHLQYPNPTMCRDRYVLPVNAYQKGAVPGLVHGSSDSGATLYIEPMEVVEPGNELGEAMGEEEEEVRRVLWDLTRRVAARHEIIVQAAEKLGEVDLVRAKARMSNAFGMCEPELAQGRTLELLEARHPILLWLSRGETDALPRREDLDFGSVVPLDMRLGDDFDVLVVTGPNTGGKTVVLKTVGLLCLMARAGMHVPARKAVVPLYDGVFADIGDEQSLEQSLSTFSSHMSRIIRILGSASRDSLVLLDELGAGTDPAEGSALGEAILKELVRLGCSAAVVTHLGRLKTFATARPQVENACVDFDSSTLRPTYHLRIGSAGSSNALEIAERLGLPPAILTAARELLDARSEGEYSSMLEEVELAREDAEERRERMQYLEGQAEKLKEQYEEVLARLQREEDRRGADLGLQIRDTLQELLQQADALHEDVRNVHRSLGQRVRAFRDGLQECLDDISELLKGHSLERPLHKGDEVYVVKLHKWGTVERVDERRGRAQVRVGQTQIDVELDELQPWGEGVQ